MSSNNQQIQKIQDKIEFFSPIARKTTTFLTPGLKVGQVRLHRQSIGTQTYNLEYGYNLAGQLISEKYPSGRIVTSGFDTGGRLSNVADASRTYAGNFQYQTNGGILSSLSLGNGTTQSFDYNDRLQMSLQELKKGTEVLQKYSYAYGQIDQNGNIVASKNNGQLGQIESYIGANKQWTRKFIYDSIGRLGKEEEFRGDNSGLVYRNQYDYDRFGNLYRKQANNPNSLSANWIEDAQISKATNRFTSATVYDDAGNVIQDTKFRNQNYWYDANGRMYRAAGVNQPNQSNVVYDASGQRVAAQAGGVWTFFIYDAFGKLVAEYGGLQAIDEGGVKYIFKDWQGSTRAIANQGGFVQSRMDYAAFGEEIYAGVGQRATQQGYGSNQVSLKNKYALTDRDESTGLDHTRWRKLDSIAGRWTSPDPYRGSMLITDPQTFNRYTYVNNDPVNFVDPSGLNMMGAGGASCYIDGVLSTCSQAFSMLQSGAGVIGPASLTRWDASANMGQGEWQFFRAFANGQTGWYNIQGISITASVMLSHPDIGSWFAGSAQWGINILGGGLTGFGGGLTYAATYENKPTRTGQARLGRPNPSARMGWERSFHIDMDRFTPTPHLNAEYGPMRRFNHRAVPNSLYRMGSTSALKGIGRGTVVLGLALDAYDIATSTPGSDRNRAVGGAVGGWGGAAAGALIGSAIAPGIGTVIGGVIGGVAGSFGGQAVGSQIR